jgi:hypothetical protein
VTLGGGIAAEVTDAIYQGSFRRVTAKANGLDILARLNPATPVAAGDRISLAIDPAHVIVLKD